MNMADKLALQQELGGLVLFRVGLFLRAYNESSYILTQLLQHDLKVNCYTLKCLGNSVVIECAFPYSTLAQRLPKAVITAFGASQSADYDLLGYDNWLAQRWLEANEVGSKPKASELSVQAASTEAPLRQQKMVYKSRISLPLTDQQLAYLQAWKKGAYPIEVDLAFIESLKNHLSIK